MTNFVETKQKQDYCGEDPSKSNAKCQIDDDCKQAITSNNWNGIPTGRCINASSSSVSDTKVCEIYAWCPPEIENKSCVHSINF